MTEDRHEIMAEEALSPRATSAGHGMPDLARSSRCDVTLTQYAAVLAALAEGHDLPRVLAQETIEPARWSDAERAWATELAEAAGEGPVAEAFERCLALGQDRYGRRLPPLDEDLRAFLDFRRRFTTHADPIAFAESLGLRLTEVTRLCRMWSERMARDPAFAERAQVILREEPGELVAPTPVRVQLPEPAETATEAATAPQGEAPGEDDAPPLFVPLPCWETDGAGASEATDAQAGAAASGEPAPNGDDCPPRVQRARPSFLLTAAFVSPTRAALPFQVKQDVAPKNLAATSAFVAPLQARALPFSSPRADSARVEAAATEGASGTAPMPALVTKAGLPFDAALARPPERATPASRTPSSLTETASFEGMSLAAVLPFVATGGTEKLPVPIPRGPSPLAMTAPISLAMGAQALPFENPSGAPEAGAGTRPKLTVGAYAAFCAELEVFPGDALETFRRHGLASVQEGVELAAAWQQRFTDNPAEYEAWSRLHRFYLTQCREKGRPEVKA